MATLVKIRGLARGSASGDAGVMKGRGLRVPVAIGTTSVVVNDGVRASLTPTANQITFSAIRGGTWANGGNLRITTALGTLAIATAFAATTGAVTVTVTAPATATVAANNAIIAALAADPVASQFMTAALSGTGAAANAATGPGNLTGGTDVGVNAPLYLRAAQNSGTIIVDVDDPRVAKVLRRSAGNYVSLGSA